MALFDAFDRRVAAAVGRVFEDPVIWRPMQAREGSTYLAGQGNRPDLTRPIRPLAGETNFKAIVTWAHGGMQVAAPTGGGEMQIATLFVDFEWILFEENYARFGIPRRFDRIELLTEKDPENRMAEITRVGDDGSSRIWCWCNILTR